MLQEGAAGILAAGGVNGFGAEYGIFIAGVTYLFNVPYLLILIADIIMRGWARCY